MQNIILLNIFFKIIRIRDNGIKNNQVLYVVTEDPMNPGKLEKSKIEVSDHMRALNYYLVKKVEDFFTKHEKKIEKTEETVVVKTVPTLTDVTSKNLLKLGVQQALELGEDYTCLDDNKEKIYDKIFSKYCRSLFRQILRNFGLRGWGMLISIFVGMIAIILLIIYRPDIWSLFS
jgi:hypothetical protein